MNKVTRSVLLPYTAHEMYGLVTDIPAYPQFIPWCARSEVLDRADDGMTARLHLAYAGLRMAFTTRNVQMPDREVLVRLVDGPFSKLEGRWGFTPIGTDAAVPACRVDFELRYEFSSWALKAVLSPVFDRVANTFVDAFVQRAAQVHGSR